MSRKIIPTNDLERWHPEQGDSKKKSEQSLWRTILKYHPIQKSESDKTVPQPLKLADISGSYIVRCKKVSYTWDIQALDGGPRDRVMTLDIHDATSPHGALASFHFGIIMGTMLLAQSADSLELLRKEVHVNSEDEDDEYAYGRMATKSTRMTMTSGGRSLGTGRYVPPSESKSLKRKEPSSAKDTTQLNPIRRRLGETPKSNRIYFQWAGRETGQCVIQVDDRNEHVGQLDFGTSKMSATGFFRYPGMWGKVNIPIEIYKVADKPSKKPEPWREYSNDKYEYERVARWG
jgi:hypothetical protein